MFNWAVAHATTTADIAGLVSTAVGEATTVILAGVGAAIALVAALIGFGYAMRWLIRKIGGARG